MVLSPSTIGKRVIKQLLPPSFKDLVKSKPAIANLLDRMLSGRGGIDVFIDIPTLMGPDEREYLFQLAKAHNPEHLIVEIGCYAGGSTYFLGMGAKLSGSLVYSVDPFDLDLKRQKNECDGSPYLKDKPAKKDVQRWMRKYGLEDIVKLTEGFSSEVAATWNGNAIGLLFIDGDHKQTHQDYQAWIPHLADGAVVVFHDYGGPIWQNVTEAVDKIIRKDGLEVLGKVDSMVALRYTTKVTIIPYSPSIAPTRPSAASLQTFS